MGYFNFSEAFLQLLGNKIDGIRVQAVNIFQNDKALYLGTFVNILLHKKEEDLRVSERVYPCVVLCPLYSLVAVKIQTVTNSDGSGDSVINKLDNPYFLN